VSIEQDVLSKNNALAKSNRSWLQEHGIVAVNLLSAPGSGKTTLLERTINTLKNEMRISVLEGDQETLNDAMRIKATGCPVIQINTGAGCHLEADMIASSMKRLNPPDNSLLFIENVGNLVCPALFDLGEEHKVVVLSVTEGEDKPLKYPHMFRAANTFILNKIDLLPHLDFDVEACISNALAVNPNLQVIKLSAKTGDGMNEWLQLLRQRLSRLSSMAHS
jgi:hydrogenase nickel incorporation protein HypB